jgi:hypothetical protein
MGNPIESTSTVELSQDPIYLRSADLSVRFPTE